MLWLAHLGWRLECDGERGWRARQAGDSLSLRHEAKGTFIHRERVITARCYGCRDVGSLLGARDRAPSRVRWERHPQ